MTYALVFRRYAPFNSFGGGFEGDTRTAPSTSPLASARTIDITYFDRTGAGRSIGLSSGTTHTIFGGHGMSKVSTRVSGVIVGATSIAFSAASAGANPLVPLAPDIDTFVDLRVTFSSQRLVVEGQVRGDTFPNAEVILYDGSRPVRAVMLFDFRTAGGRNTGPFVRLEGAHESTVLGRFGRPISIDAAGNFLAAAPTCPVTTGH
ncbi:MAG: hypothetical protein E6K32_14805 [Gammaproteobacteria bacterium]|nr:MAG: hypothetical protein E6K27_03105 [Gammaproteobacteria bacterium]TLZ38665.1 MAG: hypothetical protein E6K32_14805 [Gammaproteobacteria bacterium]